jgi:hypothetical protein
MCAEETHARMYIVHDVHCTSTTPNSTEREYSAAWVLYVVDINSTVITNATMLSSYLAQ